MCVCGVRVFGLSVCVVCDVEECERTVCVWCGVRVQCVWRFFARFLSKKTLYAIVFLTGKQSTRVGIRGD